MGSDHSFVDFVGAQMEDAGEITSRMMFGGCTIYCDRKVVALVCDDQLFVKPTEAGKSFIGNVVEAPPYTGAKSYFLIEEKLEDKEWIAGLIKKTAEELPLPKPRKKKK